MEFKRNKSELKSMGILPADVIGLTGGIASGKTAAAQALKRAGYNILDADEVSRRIFARGTDGEKRLCALFPAASENGVLLRTELRKIVSRDKNALKQLNEFTHPVIVAEIVRELAASPKPVVLVAPLLFETGLARYCDKTVTVFCPKPERIKRLCSRDRLDPDDAAAMIDAQIPDSERCTLSDFVVPSKRDKAEFEREILELFDLIVRPESRIKI